MEASGEGYIKNLLIGAKKTQKDKQEKVLLRRLVSFLEKYDTIWALVREFSMSTNTQTTMWLLLLQYQRNLIET